MSAATLVLRKAPTTRTKAANGVADADIPTEIRYDGLAWYNSERHRQVPSYKYTLEMFEGEELHEYYGTVDNVDSRSNVRSETRIVSGKLCGKRRKVCARVALATGGRPRVERTKTKAAERGLV